MPMISLALFLFTQSLFAADFKVESISPTGKAMGVKQVIIKFSKDVVAMGNLRNGPAAATISCPNKGNAVWITSKEWTYNFENNIPSLTECSITINPDLKSLAQEVITGETKYSFFTSGPIIESASPYSNLTPDGYVLVTFDIPLYKPHLVNRIYFMVPGITSRYETELVEGKAFQQVFEQQFRYESKEKKADLIERTFLFKSKRNLPEGSRVVLVADKGLVGLNGVISTSAVEKDFEVQKPFSISVSCERVRADAGCLPFRIIQVQATADVKKELMAKITLRTTYNGKEVVVKPDFMKNEKTRKDAAKEFTYVTFSGPFPSKVPLIIDIPTNLTDVDGRKLSNSKSFPVTMQTDQMPPLAKFSSNFGIYESKTDPAVPLTVRDVEAQLVIKTLHVTHKGFLNKIKSMVGINLSPNYEEIVSWIKNVAIHDRKVSVFSDPSKVQTQELKRSDMKNFEVIGLPLKSKGFFVIEAQSKLLGASLIGENETMYVPTIAFNTNLGLTFKNSPYRSMAWVTELDSGKPVSGSRVVVANCDGSILTTAKTDKTGAAFFEIPKSKQKNCSTKNYSRFNEGLFVFAESGGDFTFTHSSFNEGIENYRYNLSERTYETDKNDHIQYHTVFDRPLYRQGEGTHMIHFFRTKTFRGLKIPRIALKKIEIKHTYHQDKVFEIKGSVYDDGTISSDWQIPKDAPLGFYNVQISAKIDDIEEIFDVGEINVSEFKIPVMKATGKLSYELKENARSILLNGALKFISGVSAGDYPLSINIQASRTQRVTFNDYKDVNFGGRPVKLGIQTKNEAYETIQIAKKDIISDKAGGFSLEIPLASSNIDPLNVSASIEYHDPNGEIQTLTLNQDVPVSNVNLGIKEVRQDYGYKGVDVYAVDSKGKPLANINVVVDIFQEIYFSHRKKIVGSFYSYESHDEVAAAGTYCQGKTNDKGVLECRDKLQKNLQGTLIFQAKSKAVGLTSYATLKSWRYGDEASPRAEDHDRMDLIISKKRVEPGEILRVETTTPFEKSTALITVEREGVFDVMTQELTREKPFFDLPIKREYVPNAVISVFAVRGRVSAPQETALVDLGRPAMKLGFASIRVGLQKHTLQVNVTTAKDTYAPRDQVKSHIKVNFPDGEKKQKVFASLAVVDEGLLHIQENTSWNLLESMIVERPFLVQTSTNMLQIVGKRHFGLKALPVGGGGGVMMTRKMFDPLVKWIPKVPLNANGEADIDFELNDSLTSFRIVAVANAGDDYFGTGKKTIESTRDVLTFVGLPPIARHGETQTIEVSLKNTTKDIRNISVELESQPAGIDTKSQELTLPSLGSIVRFWNAKIPDSGSNIKYLVSIKDGDKLIDRVEMTQDLVPVLVPHVLEASLERIEKEKQLPFEAANDVDASKSLVRSVFSKSMAGSTESLELFANQYPFRCLEQLTSIAVIKNDKALWEEISAKLPSYIAANGLLAFYPITEHNSRSGDVFLTQYILSIAKDNDFTIQEDVKKRLLDKLVQIAEGRDLMATNTPYPKEAIVGALGTLARYDILRKDLLDQLKIAIERLDNARLIEYIQLLTKLNSANVKEAIQAWDARVSYSGTMLTFHDIKNERTGWDFLNDDDAVAAKTILLQLKTGIIKDQIGRLVTGFNARKMKKGVWRSTVANAYAALAMRKFKEFEGASKLSGSSSVELDGNIQKVTWDEKNNQHKVDMPWPKKNGLQNIFVKHQGEGSPWFTVQSVIQLLKPRAFTNGFSISKKYAFGKSRPKKIWEVGDMVDVTLRVRADSNYGMAAMREPLPSGVTIIPTSDYGRLNLMTSHREVGNGFLTLYFDNLAQGEYEYSYRFRINQAGQYLLPLTHIEAMYAPENFADLPNDPLIAKDKRMTP